ncbi:MAG TPA: GDSL-type esterase/lipase family protein [Candidatus Polarisedimenticolaceae bacterium]|nr:GDSL-type esterase/lipase family protein [Candidatus Polarisedimenticolaceae bacterium]
MRDFDVAVSINDQGLRDRDYPYERVPGKRRILVLGDSFAWGFGVEQPACFTELVERSLADVEVINAAVSGYSTDQELLWLVNEGLKYRPDVVLLLVSGNDVAMNMTSLAYGVYYKPQFRCNAGGDLRWPLPPVPKAGMLRRSLFASRFHSSVAQLAFQSLDRLSERWFPIDGGAAVALTLRLLEEISRRSEAIDARFLVVLHAGFWDSSVGRYDDFAAAVSRRFPETLDLGTLSEESRRVMTLRGNGHWNSIGHEWVARRVLDYLAEQGLQRVP